MKVPNCTLALIAIDFVRAVGSLLAVTRLTPVAGNVLYLSAMTAPERSASFLHSHWQDVSPRASILFGCHIRHYYKAKIVFYPANHLKR